MAAAVQLPPERTTTVGWLYVVARRQLISARRSAQRSRVDVELVEDQPDGAADLLDALEARKVIELMPSLKPQQRLVLWLQLEGYSYGEICELSRGVYVNVAGLVALGVDDMSPTPAGALTYPRDLPACALASPARSWVAQPRFWTLARLPVCRTF